MGESEVLEALWKKRLLGSLAGFSSSLPAEAVSSFAGFRMSGRRVAPLSREDRGDGLEDAELFQARHKVEWYSSVPRVPNHITSKDIYPRTLF